MELASRLRSGYSPTVSELPEVELFKRAYTGVRAFPEPVATVFDTLGVLPMPQAVCGGSQGVVHDAP